MHGIQIIHLVVQIMFISSSHMLITSRNGVTLYVYDFALRISAAREQLYVETLNSIACGSFTFLINLNHYNLIQR